MCSGIGFKFCELLIEPLLLGVECVDCFLLFGGNGEVHGGAVKLKGHAVAVLLHLKRGVVEESEEGIVILYGERIVFVVVALSAFEGGAKENGAGCVDAVENLVDTVFLGMNAGFHVAGGRAVKAGGDALAGRGIRQ